MTLVPVGEVATRVTFFSALGGAAAAWLAYRAVRAPRERRRGGPAADEPAATAAGVAAAALACAGVTFFRAATVPEVYAPTAAALAVAMLLLVRAHRAAIGSAGIVLALLGGLSLGLHAHVRLLVGPAAVLVALWRLRRGDRWPLVATTALALGAAVVAYLPLRAARAPAANWSDPRTLGGALAHLSAARIRHAFAGEMFHRIGAHLAAFARLTEAQLGLPALLCALGGLVWLCVDGAPARARRGARARPRRRRPVLGGDKPDGARRSAGWPSDGARASPSPPAPASWLSPAGSAARGAVGRRRARRARLRAGRARRRRLQARPRRRGGRTGPRAALAEAPPRARVLVESDDLAAGTTYEQYVAGERPDVAVLVRQHAWDKTEAAARLRPRRLSRPPRAATPLLWEPADRSACPRRSCPTCRSITSRDAARPRAAAAGAAAGRARDRALGAGAAIRRCASVECEALVALGRALSVARRGGAGERAVRDRARRAPGRRGRRGRSRGRARARRRRARRAWRWSTRCWRAIPIATWRASTPRAGAALAGDADGAARDFTAAHALSPAAVAPLLGLARLAQLRGDDAAARRWLSDAEKIDGSDPEVRALKKELER